MPTLYKVLTALLALTGCSSLAITGQMNPVMSSVAVALVPGYYRFFRGAPHASLRIIGMLTFTELLVFLFDAVVVTGDIFLAVAHLTIAFQAMKSFDLKEPWDHLQVYFVSLLQLIIASELTSSLAFGVVFVTFMVLLVTAMVFSHFLKEGTIDSALVRRPVFIISGLTICLTILFFVGLPRFTYRFLSRGHVRGIHTSGFSGQMDFGSLGTIKLDPTVVMRVELQGKSSGPFYWRGSTLDFFDGIAWKNKLRSRLPLSKTGDEFVLMPEGPGTAPDLRGQRLEQHIDLEPLDSDLLFGLPRIRSIRSDAYTLSTDAAGSVSLPGKASRRLRYTVVSDAADDIPGPADPLYLQVPAGSERIAELAGRLVRNVTEVAVQARIIEDHLRRNYEYSLKTAPPPKGVSPLEDFLFRTKKGYCEHYASAMVLMLRHLGIQARIVTGFLGGDRNAYGGYLIVRQSDAHSWVEARIDGQWRRFDPTPAVALQRAGGYTLFWDSVKMKWSRYVVGFKPEDRSALLGQFSAGLSRAGRLARVSDLRPLQGKTGVLLVFAASGLLLTGGIFILRRHARRAYRPGEAVYRKVSANLRREGFHISPSTTAQEIEAQASQKPYYEHLREFFAVYGQLRFGRRGDEAAVLQKARLLLRETGRKAASTDGK